MGVLNDHKIHWKLRVETCESGNEVIFPGPYGSFCGVASMGVRRNELEFQIFDEEKLFQGSWAFIVQFGETRS